MTIMRIFEILLRTRGERQRDGERERESDGVSSGRFSIPFSLRPTPNPLSLSLSL